MDGVKTSREGAELQKVWEDYKKRPTPEHRDRLVLNYSPLVKYVAGRIASRLPRSVDASDLVSYGILGLIDAVEKFDLGRNVKFSTYALARIKGAIIDELRRQDWLPRSVREKEKELEKAYQELQGELRRSPSEQEIAERLKISEEELHKLLRELSHNQFLTLDEFWGRDDKDDKVSLMDVIEDRGAENPLAALEKEERKEDVGRAIKTLPLREREIVVLYYYEGLTFKEVAEILSLTESRISQLHSKAVLHLKACLSGGD
ncbi:MAG: FliA/WhiG family RNA polymerase sigma factor [Terriglobia bacterium]